jgi:hypothetical protein
MPWMRRQNKTKLLLYSLAQNKNFNPSLAAGLRNLIW